MKVVKTERVFDYSREHRDVWVASLLLDYEVAALVRAVLGEEEEAS